MKIAIATVQVPFVDGGAEIHTLMLKNELRKRDYQAEIVTIPFKWYPWESLVNSMTMGRMMDLSEANGEKIDKVIAMKFPACYAKHDDKVLWLLHQHRQAYDLWGTPYGDLHLLSNGEELRRLIVECDNKYLPEAKRIYTNAETTRKRLKQYNNIEAKALYHPPINSDRLHCDDYGDFIFYPSRIVSIKRQILLVEAAKYVSSDVKIVLAGGGSTEEIGKIKQMIKEYELENKVFLKGFISEEEKIEYYATCLGVYFGAYNEDYGYITLEGMLSEKPVIVHPDAGGPLEFVENGKNGFVVDPDPKAIAAKLDYLYENKTLAESLGKNGKQSLIDKNLNWDYVIKQLIEG